MKFSLAKVKIPSLVNSLLAVISAVLLTLSFPDFDLWFVAWFALVSLFFAIEREKESIVKSFVLGWIFGTCFFFGTCWWLTFAPITYGGVPAIIAYPLLFGVALVAGFFPAIFSAAFSVLLKHLGTYAILYAPFLWAATEFLRFNLTGNNWNAIGYSQAFVSFLIPFAKIGGTYLLGFFIVLLNSILTILMIGIVSKEKPKSLMAILIIFVSILVLMLPVLLRLIVSPHISNYKTAYVIAVQPNVPMNGLKYEDWLNLRERHVALAENALQKIGEQPTTDDRPPITVIFPESPMNFQFENDREFQEFIKSFAIRNKVSVLFNSAEPNLRGENFYNSAVMINEHGEKIAQYDKIHLVPFGEYVPLPEPIAQFVPSMVGNFQYGSEYDLFPFGEAKGGVMICFESHFPSLSREFARSGADVLIELTNDGYLGETPVLRQHLANAVFRAVETNRPVLRVTNVGITTFINERGEVLDAAQPYTEDTRVWAISKSDGNQTFYVKFGDWFAWLCSLVSLALLSICLWTKKVSLPVNARDE
ncbi:MAG: apolipoprotein N-acyltransferase [Acidobacteria bacterium]|nr:apolipoprotein N-acyltransferase [Acidobacteriota bacterium]